MNKQLARTIVVTAIRQASALSDLIPQLKEECTQSEYEVYAKGIATISYSINEVIISPIFLLYPDIKQEIACRVETEKAAAAGII